MKDAEDNSSRSESKEENVVKKKLYMNPTIGGSLRDNFLSLSHALRTCSALVKYSLLDKKIRTCVAWPHEQ